MAAASGLFEGKRVLVFGVANDRSIAWGISQAMHEHGANLGFTYLGETLERRVRPLAESVGSDLVLPCDVGNEDEIDAVFSQVESQWGGLDVLVHSVAYASKDDMAGRFSDTSRDGFMQAMDISAYSLVALMRRARPMLTASRGNAVTLSYYGAEKVVPHYNVMGVAKAALDASVRYLAWDLGQKDVRVNAISAGPVRTLAARSIAGFPTMEAIVEERSPLHRPIGAEDVAGAAAYLLSDDARNVTGTTLYVDAGYHSVGM